MQISSRTPEGEPNRCPVCSAVIVIEPSTPLGDAPCPHCGHLLWFLHWDGRTRYIDCQDADPLIERLVMRYAELLGVSQQSLREKVEAGDYSFLTGPGADSLDVVELVMELEEGWDCP